jgi:hypothetical protein
MTEERMALIEAADGSRGGSPHWSATRLRDPARQVQRNGYRERAWETHAGRINLGPTSTPDKKYCLKSEPCGAPRDLGATPAEAN